MAQTGTYQADGPNSTRTLPGRRSPLTVIFPGKPVAPARKTGEDREMITPPNGRAPASQARASFISNSADIIAYFSLHQLAIRGAAAAVRKLSYVVDKSIYVLVASLWEAYCEDVVTEGLHHLIAYAPTYQSLPPSLLSDIEKNIRSGKDSPWILAGDGWRQHLENRREGLERKRNREFTGPKSDAVEQFFRQVLGIENLCDAWKAKGWPTICEELDDHLEKRNAIIHRITPGRVVYKRDVKEFYKIVRLLVWHTDREVDTILVRATGRSRWTTDVPVGPYEINPIHGSRTSSQSGRSRATSVGT
jgi:hypothetical protein